MAYDVPTLADFRARFPVFEDSEDAQIEALLLEASNQVDKSWREVDFKPAILYLAAHLVATDNSAEGDAIEIGSSGSGGIASESFGGMSVSYGGGASSAQGSLSSNDRFGTTEYGRRYLALLRVNRRGPIVI